MASKIRILHIIETLGRGGAEALLYTNLSRIDRERFEGLVCHLYERDFHWRHPIQQLGYPVVSLGMHSVSDAPRGLFRLWKLLAQEQVDLIHTHLYGANFIGRLAGRLKRIPVVSSIHSVDYEPSLFGHDAFTAPWKLEGIRLLDRLSCLVAAPEFIAVSDYAKRSAMTHLEIPSHRIRVIYNSVDLAAFQPYGTHAASLRAELGLAPDDPVVLCTARFHPEKGLRFLIEAIPLLVARFPRVRVLFVGSGSAEMQGFYAELAERLGVTAHIKFLGLQSDVRPYLELCDVFVLPSLCEGLGLALIEAMAMERACVATRVAALPEVVLDQETGLLVEPMDPKALSEAIARLLADPILRAKMGKLARGVAFRRFNIEHNIRELEETYQSTLRRCVKGEA